MLEVFALLPPGGCPGCAAPANVDAVLALPAPGGAALDVALPPSDAALPVVLVAGAGGGAEARGGGRRTTN